jgi:hypothetical protein
MAPSLPHRPRVPRVLDEPARNRFRSARPLCKLSAGVGMETRDLLLLIGFLRGGTMFPVAVQELHLPADRPVRVLLGTLADQERAIFGGPPLPVAPPPPSDEPASSALGDLDGIRRRAALLDDAGGRLDIEQLAGDVPDPGVLVALLYESVPLDDAGRPAPDPPPEACRATLLSMARADTEIAAKLDRHLQSPDAALLSRLDLAR